MRRWIELSSWLWFWLLVVVAAGRGAEVVRVGPASLRVGLGREFVVTVEFDGEVEESSLRLEVLPAPINAPELLEWDAESLRARWRVRLLPDRTVQLVVRARDAATGARVRPPAWILGSGERLLQGKLVAEIVAPYGRPPGRAELRLYRRWPGAESDLYRVWDAGSGEGFSLEHLPRVALYPVLVIDREDDGEVDPADLVVPYDGNLDGVVESVTPGEDAGEPIRFRVVYLDPANERLRLKDYFATSWQFVQRGPGAAARVLAADLPRIVILGLNRFERPGEIARRTGIEELDIHAALEVLRRAGLVATRSFRLEPQMLVVQPGEMAAVDAAAERRAGLLQGALEAEWGRLEEAYAALPPARYVPWKRQGFYMIGADLLDERLLRALEKDGRLITPPTDESEPSRSLGFLVAGEDARAAGRYGQRVHVQGRHRFVFFGDLIAGAEREERLREALLAAYRRLGARRFFEEFLPAQLRGAAAGAGETGADAALTEALASFPERVPVFSAEDFRRWGAACEGWLGEKVVPLLAGERARLLEDFAKLQAHNYAPLGWFVELALAKARDRVLDRLIAEGKLERPAEDLYFWIWAP